VVFEFIFMDLACGKSKSNTWPCFRVEPPSCGSLCEKAIESCGHRCRRFCHVGDCVDDEKFKCGANCMRMRSCGHLCQYSCHGTKECVEARPCGKRVLADVCPCERIQKKAVCGATRDKPGVVAGKVDCNEACRVFERNRRLANALDLDEMKTELSGEIISPELDYSENLVKFAFKERRYVLTLEKMLDDFIHGEAKVSVDYLIR
jgi:transcriptional repressor NF-X1